MAMPGDPPRREADVVVRDGSAVHVRPARPADAPAVERLLTGLSDRSHWLRFFSGHPNLDQAVRWATEVDHQHRYGLVATSGGDGRVVGHVGADDHRPPEGGTIPIQPTTMPASPGTPSTTHPGV
jgi:hypothetical protein